MSFIELRSVTKKYAKSGPPALDNLKLTMRPGEIIVLLGPSGCGKTTTLRLIGGFEQPDKGEVLIRGQVVASRISFVPPEKRGVGMVFQDYALFPHLTVEQNIMFGLKGLPKEEAAQRLREVIELVGLQEREKHYPHQISGGQQQRVALARALAPRPDVILLDEPLSNLDADLRMRMRGELDSILRKAGITAVMVTHDQEDAFSLADRVVILNEGKLEQIGTPEQIYHEPATRFVADFVGQADFIKGTMTSTGVQTALGFIPANAPLPPGEGVEVMIRPDDVALAENPSGNTSVVERHFRGSEIVYRVALETEEVVQSVQPSHFNLRVGDRVTASAEPAHVVLFTEGGQVHSCQHPSLAAPQKHLLDEAGRPKHLISADEVDEETGSSGSLIEQRES